MVKSVKSPGFSRFFLVKSPFFVVKLSISFRKHRGASSCAALSSEKSCSASSQRPHFSQALLVAPEDTAGMVLDMAGTGWFNGLGLV
jgi:hypothetical protein